MTPSLHNPPSLAQLPAHGPVLLMTGATGGLGGGVLPRLLRQRPDALLVLLIRGADTAEVARKRASLLAFADVPEADRARVLAVRGDVTQERLGLSPEDDALLAGRLTDVFHLAADLRFDHPIEQSRILNVDTTARVIDLVRRAAANGRFERFNYASTAYISGTVRGPFRETDINVGQGFFNAYEQSKMEAELLVEALKASVPVTVYRPSMIVGESLTGRIRNFFGIYEFLKLAQMGKLPILPADPLARPDLVPLDYVADALVSLSRDPGAVGRTYNLTAGLQRSESIRTIVEAIRDSVHGAALKMPQVLAQDEFERVLTGNRLRMFRNSPLNILLKTYSPYVSFERDFVVDETAAMLAGRGIVMPPILDLLPALCGFALATGFTIDTQSDTPTDTHPEPQTA